MSKMDRPWTYHKRPDNSIIVKRGDPTTGPHEQWNFYGYEDSARKFVAADDLIAAAQAGLDRLPGVMGNLVGADLEDVQIVYAALRTALNKALGKED